MILSLRIYLWIQSRASSSFVILAGESQCVGSVSRTLGVRFCSKWALERHKADLPSLFLGSGSGLDLGEKLITHSGSPA